MAATIMHEQHPHWDRHGHPRQRSVRVGARLHLGCVGARLHY